MADNMEVKEVTVQVVLDIILILIGKIVLKYYILTSAKLKVGILDHELVYSFTIVLYLW